MAQTNNQGRVLVLREGPDVVVRAVDPQDPGTDAGVLAAVTWGDGDAACPAEELDPAVRAWERAQAIWRQPVHARAITRSMPRMVFSNFSANLRIYHFISFPVCPIFHIREQLLTYQIP